VESINPQKKTAGLEIWVKSKPAVCFSGGLEQRIGKNDPYC